MAAEASAPPPDRVAWATLVMRGDAYIAGALVTAFSLRKSETRYSITICRAFSLPPRSISVLLACVCPGLNWCAWSPMTYRPRDANNWLRYLIMLSRSLTCGTSANPCVPPNSVNTTDRGSPTALPSGLAYPLSSIGS